MTQESNGGSAFPLASPATYRERHGMTLRDYFAAKALQSSFGNPIPTSQEEKNYLAMHCYQMADAMLEARRR